MRVYVLQRSLRHRDGVEKKCFPVEGYSTRARANAAAKKANDKATIWFYHVRRTSLKVVDMEKNDG